MTDRPGSRARWGTAALVAPAGAALIAVTTGWALHHNPLATASAASTASTASTAKPVTTVAPVDPQAAALRNQLTAQQQQLAALQNQLAAVRGQIQAVQAEPVTAPPVAAGGGGGSGSGGGGAAVGSGSQPQAYVPPVVRQVQAAPPAHTTTGASGARP